MHRAPRGRVGQPVGALAGGGLGESDQRGDPAAPRRRGARARRRSPRRSGASGRGPRPGSRAGESSGRTTSARTRLARVGDRLGDQPRVAVDVADGGVDLRQRNGESHWGVGSSAHSMFRALDRNRRTRWGRRPCSWPRSAPSPAAAPALAQQPGDRAVRRRGLGRRSTAAQQALAPADGAGRSRGGAAGERGPERPRRRLPGARATARVARPEGCSRGRPTAPRTVRRRLSGRGAPVASAESPHFCVFWVSDAGYPDAPDLTDADRRRRPRLRRVDPRDRRVLLRHRGRARDRSAGRRPKPDTQGCGDRPERCGRTST